MGEAKATEVKTALDLARRLLDTEMLDRIVVGEGRFLSMREKELGCECEVS